MASENQGLHAALIVLFILVLVLSVTSFMFFKEYKAADVRSQTDKAAAVEAQNHERQLQTDFNELVKIIGLPVTGTEDFKAVQDAFTADVATYMSAAPEEKRFYRQALEEMSATIKTLQAEKTAVEENLASERVKNQAFEESSTKQVAAANEARDAAIAELEKEKSAKQTAEAHAQTEIRNATDLAARAQEEKAAEVDRLNKEITKLKSTIATLEKNVQGLAEEKGKYIPKPTDLFDGEIRNIDQRNRVVYINRGSTDFLRRGMTFSVHTPDSQPTGENKARIEVLDVIEDHLASARILEDDINDPILPGDKIYTNLWDPGRPEHIAVIGRIDLDGDGGDDQDKVLTLIRGSGAVVDLSIDDDGHTTGHITPATRYLIKGSDPKQTAMTAFTAALNDARQLGVQIIPGDRFLDEIGWKSDASVVRFGSNSNAADQTLNRPDGGLPSTRGTLSDAFRTRRPPGAAPSSAYPDASAAPAP